MSRLQSLDDLDNNDFKNILDSIDYVFLDIDGVLLHNKTILPGTIEGVRKLRQLGKKIAIVSNNSVYSLEVLLKNLRHFGTTADEIVTPNHALIAYLKKLDFKKDIYVISCSLPKQLLKEEGFNVIEYKDIHQDVLKTIGDFETLSLKVLEVCKNVGAVLVDLDFNLGLGALQSAKVILNHLEENVLFLTGMTDDTGNINEKMKFIVSKYYIDGLERWSKRESITMAKPGIALKDALNAKFNISDDSRVLFIGDNVYTDIAFGVNCGYKTCLLLSGVTSKSQVDEWVFPEDYKPTFISQSFDEIYEKIKDF